MGVTVLGIQHNFYPRSPCGERPKKWCDLCAIRDFYPRSPCGERREEKKGLYLSLEFLSTLSLRRATLRKQYALAFQEISIHALLAESDSKSRTFRSPLRISIHALLAESDQAGHFSGAAP